MYLPCYSLYQTHISLLRSEDASSRSFSKHSLSAALRRRSRKVATSSNISTVITLLRGTANTGILSVIVARRHGQFKILCTWQTIKARARIHALCALKLVAHFGAKNDVSALAVILNFITRISILSDARCYFAANKTAGSRA